MTPDIFFPLNPGEGPSAPRAPRTESAEIADLKLEIERLLLVSEALWTILKEKTGIDEEELVRQMVAIDLRDGKLDGKLPRNPPTPCPKCKRVLSKRHVRCLYCGEPVRPEPFAR